MRYGAITFVWTSPFTTGELGLVRRVADLGFDAIEVAVEQPGLLEGAALRDALDEAGIEALVIGFGTADRDLSSDDEGVRSSGLEYAKFCVDLAARAGAKVLAGPLNSAVGKARMLSPDDRRSERQRAVEGLREVADYAGERGIKLALEPLNRWENDMLNTVDQGTDLCAAIDRDNVGLLLDTFHMNIEEKRIGDAIRSAGSLLVHFHACENDRSAPGSAHVDWSEVRDALRDAGYDDVASLESFVPTIPELATAVSMWRPAYDDPDAFARDGLAHLKALFG